MRWLEQLTTNQLVGRRVLLRLDLNVPLDHGLVRDDFRIQKIVPTVKRLLAMPCEVVILSHLSEPGASLEPLVASLRQFFPVKFITNFNDVPATGPAGTVILLQNLRLDAGEETNSLDFAKQLAALGDVYINEAFSVSHRAHASIVSLPTLLPSAAGPEFATEVRELSTLFQPELPLTVIIGGAKFGTKLPLVRRFLKLANKIFIGGALAHPFFKLAGYEIGQSLYDDSVRDLDDLLADRRIVLPAEVLVRQAGKVFATTPDQVPRDGVIVDAGPGALGQLAELVSEAKTILWNGPLGTYEQGYGSATADLAQLIAHRGARAVIGGGDTIAAISALGLLDRFSFVSLGGGAMLDFLVEGTLPGIKALEENEKQFPEF